MTAQSTVQADGLLRRFAELKAIPIRKVIRNAARDFVQAALKETPIAAEKKSRFVRAKLSNGKYAYRPVDSLSEDELKKKDKSKNLVWHRIRIKRGWNRATWRGVMAALGMNQKPKPKVVPSAVDTRSAAVWAGSDAAPEVTITDRLALDAAYPGQLDKLRSAGFALAAKRITTEFNRLLKNGK